MRICVVTHYGLPHIGGIEAISLEQAALLAEQGYEVTIVTSKTGSEPPDAISQMVRVRRIRAFNTLENQFGIPYPIFLPAAFSVLKSEISRSNVCLIYSFGFMSSFIASCMCIYLGRPYILYQFNTFLHYSNPLLCLLERINDGLIGRFVLTHATRILAVNKHTRDYVQSLVSREVTLLNEAVAIPRADSNFTRMDHRSRLGLPQEKNIILTVGRFVYKRSMITLLEAAQVLRRKEDLFFVLLGTGPEHVRLADYMVAHSLSSCRLPGAVPHEDVASYYQAADIFVITSRTGEGLPIALLEAWAAKLPVVATRSASQGVVINGSNGLVVEDCSPTQLALAIEYAINNPVETNRIAEEGFKTVLRDFTWSSHIGDFQQILNSLY